MPGRQIILSFLCSLASAANAAEVYTWTDAQGGVHFSGTKPTQQPHKHVELQEPSSIPMRENIVRGRRMSAINREIDQIQRSGGHRRAPAPKEVKEAKAEKRLAAKCESYRERLENIQQRLRAGYSNDQGNRLRRQRREVSQKLSRECLLD